MLLYYYLLYNILLLLQLGKLLREGKRSAAADRQASCLVPSVQGIIGRPTLMSDLKLAWKAASAGLWTLGFGPISMSSRSKEVVSLLLFLYLAVLYREVARQTEKHSKHQKERNSFSGVPAEGLEWTVFG